MIAARRLTRTTHRAVALLGTGALLASLVVMGALPAAPAAAAQDDQGYVETKTLTREHVNADGSTTVVDSRDVTVTVDTTTNLRGRQRISVSWTGAHPSGARAISPFGYGGVNQEYPVVIMQCRGIDDPSLPVGQQLDQETCWTTTYLQRFASAGLSQAAWRHDRYASAADLAPQNPATWPAVCGTPIPATFFAQRLLPFRAQNGTVFQSCNEATIPPESSIDAALPAAEVAAFTTSEGTGHVQFEVRTETENESLGCSDTVPCSLVVIPIMGLSCADGDVECRKTGQFAPGSSNFVNSGVDVTVSSTYWWSESNWRNRFSVPLTFGLPPDACDVLDDRAPVDMYGSELLSQASLQWAPAYCLRADRFKFRHNRMAESVALRLLGTGEGVAAFVSESAAASAVPLGYAPVAVTGFGVAFAVDLPDNAGEVTSLRLTPRLLAKLLTQSYPASPAGQGHPGLADNPLSLDVDPEFIALNPGLAQHGWEAGSTVLSLSESSDVLTAVTEYIAADEEAMSFLGGAADPWGMKVNPAYQGIEVPRAEWPMLDTWVKPSLQECEQQVQSPYLSLVAAPVSSMRKVAEAVLDGWPNVQTRCTRSTTTDPWKFGRIERQPYGSRFMLGLVSLGDAERYGLRTAELRTSGAGETATFVAPSDASLATALGSATQASTAGPFTIDRASLPATAYPGTMIVHATTRLTGLTAANASYVAQFVETATTEGQVRGPANGELPAGYLPITQTGVTAPLFASAQSVAALIRAQQGLPVTPPTPVATPLPSTGVTTVAAAPRATSPAGVVVAPTATAGLPAPAADAAGVAVSAGTTVVQRSSTGRHAITGSLAAALAGVVGAPALWAWSTRRRLA